MKNSRYTMICAVLLIAGVHGCSSDDGPADNTAGGGGAGTSGEAGAGGNGTPGTGGAGGNATAGSGASAGTSGGGAGSPSVENACTAPFSPQVEPLDPTVALPLLFVHGFAGSAQQYQSQSMRFVANGYPQERIRALDHDGSGFNIPGYANEVDAVVDQLLAEFGVEQVYLVGHSRGTLVSSAYLGNAQRAAKVAKYIALDGGNCNVTPTCLALNQAGLGGQAHVEVAVSAESFAAQFEFLVGSQPTTTDILPAEGEPVMISGRAVDFPANTGKNGATLEIYEIDPETGHRLSNEPIIAPITLGADGNWGPIEVGCGKHYEKVISVPDSPRSQHFYTQPYVRSTPFVRLLSGPPDSPTAQNTHTGDDHAAAILMRMREWYGTGSDADILEVKTVSASGDHEVANAIVARMERGSIALHLHDDPASPGESTLGPLAVSGAFQVTADVFMPAASPPDGTITFTNISRGDTSKPQIVNVPNWASSGHQIMIYYNDYVQ